MSNDAAKRAAVKIVEFTFEDYPDNDMNRGQLIDHVAEIISSELNTSKDDQVDEGKTPRDVSGKVGETSTGLLPCPFCGESPKPDPVNEKWFAVRHTEWCWLSQQGRDVTAHNSVRNEKWNTRIRSDDQPESYTNDDGILVHVAEFRVCDPCVRLQGQECHTPDCVFCFQPVSVAKEVLDKTLVCPIIDGERIVLIGTQETKSGASPAVSVDTPASSLLNKTESEICGHGVLKEKCDYCSGATLESIDSLPTNSATEEKS